MRQDGTGESYGIGKAVCLSDNRDFVYLNAHGKNK